MKSNSLLFQVLGLALILMLVTSITLYLAYAESTLLILILVNLIGIALSFIFFWKLLIRTHTQALEEKQKKFELMAHAIDQVHWLATPGAPSGHKVQYISPGFEKIWGYSVKEIFENPALWFLAIHPDDQEKTKNALMNSTGEAFEVEYRIRRPDGELRWILDKWFPIKNEEGKIIYICGVASDISRDKRNQETIEKQQLQLSHASKMSALGQLAGGIAHEINNPLTSINLNANIIHDLMKQNELSEKDKEFVLYTIQKIQSTSDRIGKIIKGLRSFARGGEKDPLQEVSLKEIVHDVLEFCQPKFREDNISLSVSDISPTLFLMCHPVQIQQVLLNLLHNSLDAVKMSQEKWVKIEVKDHAAHFELSVVDNGVGVSDEIKEKIMEPFFTTKTFGQGSGLGLSISMGIIQLHSGRIWLDNSSSHTRFVIELPKSKNCLEVES